MLSKHTSDLQRQVSLILLHRWNLKTHKSNRRTIKIVTKGMREQEKRDREEAGQYDQNVFYVH